MLQQARRHLAAAAMLAACLSSAHSMELDPIKVSILAGRSATALTIRNSAQDARVYDVRVARWLGHGAEGMRTADTKWILLSRPVVTVPGGAAATVRLAVAERSSAPTDYYRVTVEDITPVPDGAPAGTKVKFSLPMEVVNAFSARGILAQTEAGLKNIGTAAVVIVKADGRDPDVRYVLPGETWATPLALEAIEWRSGIQ